MIAIIAVLCSLSAPANCHEQTVTTSDFADVSMQSCLMGAPQLADGMKYHPAERLQRGAQAGWQGSLGEMSASSPTQSAMDRGAGFRDPNLGRPFTSAESCITALLPPTLRVWAVRSRPRVEEGIGLI
jgi:hypothetical protein